MSTMGKPLNADITNCLRQLADRADEIGEPNTAIVLYALCAHRTVSADLAMALMAQEQLDLLQNVLTTGGFGHILPLGQVPPIDWPDELKAPPQPPPTKPNPDEPKS